MLGLLDAGADITATTKVTELYRAMRHIHCMDLFGDHFGTNRCKHAEPDLVDFCALYLEQPYVDALDLALARHRASRGALSCISLLVSRGANCRPGLLRIVAEKGDRELVNTVLAAGGEELYALRLRRKK